MKSERRLTSSWQPWVRSSERSASPDLPEPAPAEPEVEPVAGDEPGAAVSGDLAFDPIDAPLVPAGGRSDVATAEDDVDLAVVEEEVAEDVELAEDAEVADEDGYDVYEDDDTDDTDDFGDFGELVPAVPLLPTIVGRVEALSGVLFSISHSIDGLSASTDVYRAVTVDRIEQFTDAVLEQSRRADQSLEEYRRTTERAITELRRRIVEQGDTATKLLGRIEEIATDISSLVGAWPESVPRTAEVDLGPLLARLGEVNALVEVSIDTRPGSAERPRPDVAAAIAELTAAVDAPRQRTEAAAPALDAAAVGSIADAVVARLDLEALAALVADQLSTTTEGVDDADSASAGSKRRRRK